MKQPRIFSQRRNLIVILAVALLMILAAVALSSWRAQKNAELRDFETPVPAKTTTPINKTIQDSDAGYTVTLFEITKGIAIDPRDSKDDLWKGMSVVLLKLKLENSDKVYQRPKLSDMKLTGNSDGEVFTISKESLFTHTYDELRKTHSPLLVDALDEQPNGMGTVEGYAAYVIDNSALDHMIFTYSRPKVSIIGTAKTIPKFERTINVTK